MTTSPTSGTSEAGPTLQELLSFEFKPFAEMTEADYHRIGFRGGLEIHQQLLTEKKLFCRCPAGRYSDHYHAEVLRHMRPTLSELGEYDGTALMEFKTRKEIIYRINRDTVCTYEIDDTPPFELNEEALDIALGIAMLYRCSMVDEIHIARKQYLDGSIPTGFQRTTIVGVNGRIPFGDREVRIVQLGLEEDACREVSDAGHRRVYLTDRLGMPLIETVTAPDMRTPHEVAAVGEICRRLVRSTGWVRTGIGAARQDVNVSVTGGTRIEIKGVPQIPRIPLLTYHEAMRQCSLLRLRAELHRRGVTSAAFASRTTEVTRILRKTRFQPIRTAIAEGKVVFGVNLAGFRDLLRWPTQTDTTFSREISDRVRVIACLTTLPNIVHSDSQSETLAAAEWQEIKRATGAGDNDTVVVVWGATADAETAAREVAIRAREAAVGIPSETRQALRDGTNGFERILPGPDRMYPDTDLPPKRIAADRLERLRRRLPTHFWEREAWCRELGVPADLVGQLAISRHWALFETAVREWALAPALVAVTLIQLPKRLQRKGICTAGLTAADFEGILAACRDGRLAREGLLPALARAAAAGAFSPDQLPPPLPPDGLEAALARGLEQLAALAVPGPEQRFRTAMGLVMPELAGRVPGARVAARIATRLQEESHVR
jgi:glutamyl-tRNA(Gln) amidotransferase subunit E